MVTCWTCHRGTTPPATTPAIDAIYSDPVPMYPDVLPQASAGAVVPSIDQILDKYIQALGGADALSKITSYSGKGTSTTFGADQPNPAEIYAKAPDKYVTIVHQREGDMVRTYDGNDAWVVLPLTVTGEYKLTATAAEGGKLDGQTGVPGEHQGIFQDLAGELSSQSPCMTASPGCPAKIPDSGNPGHDVYVVQGSGPRRFYRDVLFRQADRPAHCAWFAMPIRRWDAFPRRSTSARLSSGGGSDDALQAQLRLGERPRGVHAHRNQAERSGGRREVRQTARTATAAKVTPA